MQSQLTLRFPKNLIECLKNRATTENTSVNALAERLMEISLVGSAAAEEYLQLVTDPDAALAKLYRQLILGQTLGTTEISRDTLRFMLDLAYAAYARGQSQLVNRSRLQILLDITGELLFWQLENGHAVDSHYLKGTFGIQGDDWRAEWKSFQSHLTTAVTQQYAEHLFRPLASGGLDLNTFPDNVLAGVFTTPRLQAIFPLCMYARQWSFDRRREFMDQVRPIVPAVRETFDTGSVKFQIQIQGQELGIRTSSWYDTPRLYLLLIGQDFAMLFGWSQFCELLRTISAPEVLHQGWTGDAVRLYPPTTTTREVTIELDALRIFLPVEGAEALVQELISRSGEGVLADALTGLRCLYGDL